MKGPILVSACLIGRCCRYDGTGKELPELLRLGERCRLVPVCPECLGGLPTPRPPAERQGNRVVNREGEDVTEAYRRGAEQALRIALEHRCTAAVLKERSPSCGAGRIYDGTFRHILTAGDGVTAELLRKNGITVVGESQIHTLL
ncbi:DUF523 domain-containing protein [Oscillibacter sp. MSJ-2]|uniref:DUF523 domain-containing protein n=1 Tax=Dysosmobacter acutus TaxID=2841504 RepID=A0ABS6FBA2_9FIRM|nr:DUF523 domain-containing protein [Dysosmobacter acutus]MBU5626589.1 DUF523 domain-containing protein [Dysosmobacter acutus]